MKDGLEFRLVNSKQLAEMLNVSPRTLLRSRKRREIPYIRLGGKVLYDLSRVRMALERLEIRTIGQ